MKIVFAGTPDFAAVALDALVSAAADAGWTVPLVLTQPDRPAGRGMKTHASPVKQLALFHGLEVDTPASLRKGDGVDTAQARLKAVAPDVLVVAAYGLILPPEV
ncbi:MAG TPA: formyltransferase family protein, partial [Burkholderiaceae bacterium]|nr:formyltransferase family protein [Burkholderiaceae bacterium]